MRVPWASDWLSVHLAAVFLSSSPGERLQTSSGRIKGEVFVTRERYEHPLEGEAGPGAGRLQSHRKQAMNTGKREPTAGPLTRPRSRRAASAHVGRRPAWLCWQAQRAATAGRAGQGWPGGGGLALSRAATEPNRRAWNGHPGFRPGGNATAFLNTYWNYCCVLPKAIAQIHQAASYTVVMKGLSI